MKERSFDAINWRSATAIKIALCLILGFQNDDMAEMTSVQWVEHLCDNAKPKQILVAHFTHALNMVHDVDSLDFNTAANCKAGTKHLIDLINEDRNMTFCTNQIIRGMDQVPREIKVLG